MEEKNDKTAEKNEREREKSEKVQRNFFRGFMKVIIWCFVIILVVFLTLFFSARIAEFDSIDSMLRFIFSQF